MATTFAPITPPPRRVLDGGSAYDQGFTLAGAGGLFFYPPTFVPLVLPLALMPVEAATWAWTAMMLVAFALAVVSMPVAWRTRWLVVLLAGLSWPFVHNIKLGQVGPLLLLLFALAWRWRDRPVLFGVLSALGACLKVQPVLLLVWAAIRRQWPAVIAAIVTFGILAGIALLVTGPGAWSDFASSSPESLTRSRRRRTRLPVPSRGSWARRGSWHSNSSLHRRSRWVSSWWPRPSGCRGTAH